MSVLRTLNPGILAFLFHPWRLYLLLLLAPISKLESPLRSSLALISKYLFQEWFRKQLPLLYSTSYFFSCLRLLFVANTCASTYVRVWAHPKGPNRNGPVCHRLIKVWMFDHAAIYLLDHGNFLLIRSLMFCLCMTLPLWTRGTAIPAASPWRDHHICCALCLSWRKKAVVT
jgi:hypothetical protein